MVEWNGMSCLLDIRHVLEGLEGFMVKGRVKRSISKSLFYDPNISPVRIGMILQAYDAAINDLAEVAEQQAGRPNRIDDLMTEAEQVRSSLC